MNFDFDSINCDSETRKELDEIKNLCKNNQYSTAYYRLDKLSKMLYEKDLTSNDLTHSNLRTAKRIGDFSKIIKENFNIEEEKPVNDAFNNSYFSNNKTNCSPSSNKIDSKNVVGKYVEFFSPEELNTTFDDVIGLEDAKKMIKSAKNIVENPDAYYGVGAGMKLLLFGPPGTGKTTLAKALASELKWPFCTVSAQSILNSKLGGTEGAIAAMFDEIHNFCETNRVNIIVFFDEFDGIARKDNGGDVSAQTVLPTLKQKLDGVSKTTNGNILFIANTNHIDDLDDAIISRFRQPIYCGLPNKNNLIDLFKLKLKNVEDEYISELDFDTIGDCAIGRSGRKIDEICNDFKIHIGDIKTGHAEKDNLQNVMLNLIKRVKAASDDEYLQEAEKYCSNK